MICVHAYKQEYNIITRVASLSTRDKAAYLQLFPGGKPANEAELGVYEPIAIQHSGIHNNFTTVQ